MYMSEKLKASLCMTVRNEQGSIETLMDSLLNQSRTPDEVFVVDGGSSDRTLQLLQVYHVRYPHVKVVSAPHANIAAGRNLSIGHAQHDTVATADAGMEYPPTWLDNLLRPFEADSAVDVVLGFYAPKSCTLFEKCVGEMLYPKKNLIDWEKFLPSCGSVAFKKRVWGELGGFAEWLPGGIAEDTLFSFGLEKWATDSRMLLKRLVIGAHGKIIGRFLSNGFFTPEEVQLVGLIQRGSTHGLQAIAISVGSSKKVSSCI